MLKKSLLLLSIPISFFYLKAQDVSVIRNTADAYSDTSINGSAKYNAMAGSMGALGGDISATSVNPAGLGVYISNDVNATLGIFSNKNTTTLAGKSMNYTINKVDVNNIGGVLSINLGDRSKLKFINIGVNYSYHSLENYSESPENRNIQIVDDYSYSTPITYTFLGHAYNRYGDISKTNFAVGANLNNRFYLGLGLNFQNLYINQFDSASFNSSYDNTDLVYNKQYTDYEEHSNGFAANVGIIAKITNQFRLGAAIESPTWWSINRTYSQYYFNDSQVDLAQEDRTLMTPFKTTLSAAFVPNKNFAINIDYIASLSRPHYTEDGVAEEELNDFMKQNYKNSSEVRIGAEYRVKGFRLRAGYAYQTSPFDKMSILAYNDNGSSSTNSYSNLILGKKSTIGAGIGYDFKVFYLDLTYQNIMSEYKNPFLYGNVNYDSGYFNSGFDVNSDASAVSNVKNNKNNVFLTAGWRF